MLAQARCWRGRGAGAVRAWRGRGAGAYIPDLPKKSAMASLKAEAKNFIFQSATRMQPVSSSSCSSK
jgi:hypothetical protein